MSELKLGFALEGNSDYPVIPCLARRVVEESFPEITFAPDSVLRPSKRGHGFIRELPTFARQLQADNVNIVVAVVDTDATRVNERRQRLCQARQSCEERGVAVCIAQGLAVRSLEAWLLADEAAILDVFDGDRSGVTFPSPEHEEAPKATLNHIVRVLTAGREVSFASYAEELSRAIRLSTLRRKCPQFDDFARNLVNCVREWKRSGIELPALAESQTKPDISAH